MLARTPTEGAKQIPADAASRKGIRLMEEGCHPEDRDGT